MTTITMRHYGAHTAYLDPMTGEGLLVRPRPDDDLALAGPVSLHAADWDACLRDLDALGWEPSVDDFEEPIVNGHTANGCEVIGLYYRDPLTSRPSIEECVGAMAELRRCAGMA